MSCPLDQKLCEIKFCEMRAKEQRASFTGFALSSLETTLKNWRNPESSRNNTWQSLGLILSCNKVLMVDPALLLFLTVFAIRGAGSQPQCPHQNFSYSRRKAPFCQLHSTVVFGSRKRWDRWHSPSPNWQEKCHLYTTFIVLAFCRVIAVICYRSHLVGEPETTIDIFSPRLPKIRG